MHEGSPSKRYVITFAVIIIGAIGWFLYVDYSVGSSSEKESAASAISPAARPMVQQAAIRLLTPTVTPPTATPTIPAATPTQTPTPAPVTYRVKQGDTLLAIAYAHEVNMDDIVALNTSINPASLQIGDEIIMPITPTPTPRFSPTPTVTNTPTPEPVTHVIQFGDTLLALAYEYDTTVEAIMITNDFYNPQGLQVGAELLIPVGQTGSIMGVPTTIYTINAGDTLISIAAKFKTTVDDILANNPDLEPTLMSIGQEIIVPVAPERIARNPGVPRVAVPLPPAEDIADLEQQMFQLVNANREANGLAPYGLDAELQKSARAHAQDMVARGYFSHGTPEGLSVRDRLEAQGTYFGWVGENIQRNVQPIENSAQYATNWFMGSTHHRNNILHGRYTKIGVGVVEGPPSWYTYVIVFGGE